MTYSRKLDYIDEENTNFMKYLKFLDKNKIDLLTYTRILIPILIKNKPAFSDFLDQSTQEKFHWALVSVNLKNKKMILYDSKYSFSEEGKSAMQIIAKFFDFYFEKKNRKSSSSTSTPKNFDKNTYTTSNSSSHFIESEYFENRFDSEESSDDEDTPQNLTTVTSNLSFNFEDDIYFNCRRVLNFDDDSNEKEQEDKKIAIGNKWRFKFANNPMQLNHNEADSGVFVCKFMEYLTREEPILFCKEDTEYFRILMSIELIESGLLT
jgi:hypothetical protein